MHTVVTDCYIDGSTFFPFSFDVAIVVVYQQVPPVFQRDSINAGIVVGQVNECYWTPAFSVVFTPGGSNGAVVLGTA